MHMACILNKRDAGPTSIAPFQERLVSESGTRTTGGAGQGLSAKEGKQQQQQQQHALVTALNRGSRTRNQQPFRPISAVRAVAKVVAAEAAVSAAAAALVPSSKAAPSKQLAAHKSTERKALQHPRQQEHGPTDDNDTTIKASSTRGDCAGSCLQVCGNRTGPRRSTQSLPGALHRCSADHVGGTTSSAAGGGTAPAVCTSLAGSIDHLASAQLSIQAQQLLQVQGLLQTLSLSGGVAGNSFYPHAPAAAQLAASGISKRLRAQLRSAHGPPPFQRSAPPPRPASPPPVVLTGEMLLAHSLEPASPAGTAMADLSSCSISSICLLETPSGPAAPAATTTAAPGVSPQSTTASAGSAGVQGQLLQQLGSLVSLDLSDNRLQCFAGLAVLFNLQQLNLSANRIRSLQRLEQATHSSLTSCSGACGGECEAAGECSSTGMQESLDPYAEQAGQEPTVGCNPLSSCAGMLPQAAHLENQPEAFEMSQHSTEQQNQDCGPCIGPQSVYRPADGSSSAVMSSASPVAIREPGELSCGFAALEVLDLSYNLLSGNVLLGPASPLGVLPRLCELHSAGNSITDLPHQLAAFTSLTCLNLQHNQLHMPAVAALGQLPALQLLDVSRNPLTGSWPAGSAVGFVALQALNLSSSKVKQLMVVQQLLGCMLKLQVLQLVHTPLAERCRANKVQEHELARPGLTVVLNNTTSSQGSSSQRQTAQQAKHQPAVHRVPVVQVTEVPPSGKVLAAAGRAALAGLPHDQLVAVFDRVAAGIDNWQQLAPVMEEDSCCEWQEDGCVTAADHQQQLQGHAGAGAKPTAAADDDDSTVDKTFLTGVGITGELPDEEGVQDAASSQGPTTDQAGSWQDPTERLAIALGLRVSQLVHMTGRMPGNPDAALHRLRHALTHPLVDPDAGQRPQQHHMSLTAATAAKQQPGRLVPLPKAISPALSTRVEVVPDLNSQLQAMRNRLTAMQGSLLPQLQAQALKINPEAAGCSTPGPGGCGGARSSSKAALG